MREDQQREGNAVSDNDTRSFRSYFQNRVMAGLFATLPLFVTLWVIQFTYILLSTPSCNSFFGLLVLNRDRICPGGGRA
jgi:hypothetical protein